MSINDIIEDLKSDIQEKELLNETEDDETNKSQLNDEICNLKQELYNIFDIIDYGKSR